MIFLSNLREYLQKDIIKKSMYNFKIGDVHSFGKNIVEFAGNKYKIHYIVFKRTIDESSSEFIAVALDFGYFGVASEFNEAVKIVFHQVTGLKNRVKSKNEFLFNIEGVDIEEYWELYRKISYNNGESENQQNKKLETQNKALEENERELIEEIFSHRITIDMLQKALEVESSKSPTRTT